MAQEPIPLPEAVLARHPELVQIHQALTEYFAGQPITARCPTCGQVLQVKDFPAIGSRWVLCGNGCTNHHTKYEPIVSAQ
jgi:hypothetical protein